MRRLRERPDKHYRGERCTSRLNSHGFGGLATQNNEQIRPQEGARLG